LYNNATTNRREIKRVTEKGRGKLEKASQRKLGNGKAFLSLVK